MSFAAFPCHFALDCPHAATLVASSLTPDAFTENFGPTGLLDDILGTNKQYKVWLTELRRRDGEGWKHAARTALADATQ